MGLRVKYRRHQVPCYQHVSVLINSFQQPMIHVIRLQFQTYESQFARHLISVTIFDFPSMGVDSHEADTAGGELGELCTSEATTASLSTSQASAASCARAAHEQARRRRGHERTRERWQRGSDNRRLHGCVKKAYLSSCRKSLEVSKLKREC
jgi:hypothetical protein